MLFFLPLMENWKNKTAAQEHHGPVKHSELVGSKSHFRCSCNTRSSNAGHDLYLQQIHATLPPRSVLQDLILNLYWGRLTLFVHKGPSSTSFDLVWDCQGAAVLQSSTVTFICVGINTYRHQHFILILFG